MSGNEDGCEVAVTDVLAESVARVAVECHDARPAGEADEEIALATQVIVQAADGARTRLGHVGLPNRIRELALPRDFGKPPALVVETTKRKHLRARQSLFTPLARTKSLTS